MKDTLPLGSLLIVKAKAALLHAALTLLVALVSAWVVFYVWYPSQLASLMDGDELYLLVLAVEICLGPLMSLVIYNPRKPRAELIRDYLIVGVIQLAALVYGLHSTYIARPVFMVFVIDRVEVISALELMESDLLAGSSKAYQSLPVTGPVEVCSARPADPEKRSTLLFSALDGKDIHLMPEYYRACTPGERFRSAKAGAVLIDGLKQAARYEAVAGKLPKDLDFTWLPVKNRFKAWVEIYPKGEQGQAYYVDVNPFL